MEIYTCAWVFLDKHAWYKSVHYRYMMKLKVYSERILSA